MTAALRIDTVRGRLTAFYISVLGAALIIVGGRHRLALRRVVITPYNAKYIVVAGSSLEPTDEELNLCGKSWRMSSLSR